MLCLAVGSVWTSLTRTASSDPGLSHQQSESWLGGFGSLGLGSSPECLTVRDSSPPLARAPCCFSAGWRRVAVWGTLSPHTSSATACHLVPKPMPLIFVFYNSITLPRPISVRTWKVCMSSNKRFTVKIRLSTIVGELEVKVCIMS